MDPVAQPGNPGINTQGGGLAAPTFEGGTYQDGERALAGFDPWSVGSGAPGATTTTPNPGDHRPNLSGSYREAPTAAPQPGQPAAAPEQDRSGWPEWAQKPQPGQPQPGAQPGQPQPGQPGAQPGQLLTIDFPGLGQIMVTPEQAAQLNAAMEQAQQSQAQQQQEALKTEWQGYQTEEQKWFQDHGTNLQRLMTPAAIDKWVAEDLVDPSIAAHLKNAYAIAAEVIRDGYERNPAIMYELAELRHRVAEQDKALAGMRTSTAKESVSGVEAAILQTPQFQGADMVSVRREGERAVAEGRSAQEVRAAMEAEAARTASRGQVVAKAAHQMQVLQQARDGQGRFAPSAAPAAVPPSNAALPPRTSGIPDPDADPIGFGNYLKAVQANIGASRQGT